MRSTHNLLTLWYLLDFQVSALVVSAVSVERERFLAVPACVRSHTGMNPHMDMKVSLPVENLIAVFVRTLEDLGLRVLRLLVLMELVLSWEGAPAVGIVTWELLRTGLLVEALVEFQVVFQLVGFTAGLADKVSDRELWTKLILLMWVSTWDTIWVLTFPTVVKLFWQSTNGQ